MSLTPITIEVSIKARLEKVWEYFTDPKHVVNWNTASSDWHTPKAENDLRAGGAFSYRMEARDGSEGFDFGGIYDEVVPQERIAYTMGDGRKVSVEFISENGEVKVVETFDPEAVNSVELQKSGWQSVLDNFKQYVEGN